MLTNQIIGAGQNVSSHTPRQSTPVEPVQPVSQPSVAGRPHGSVDQITARPVDPNQDTQCADKESRDRPPLELPKRAELSIAVIDSMPDAVPESIYDAKVHSKAQDKPMAPTE